MTKAEIREEFALKKKSLLWYLEKDSKIFNMRDLSPENRGPVRTSKKN
jgi:hypothetical protein